MTSNHDARPASPAASRRTRRASYRFVTVGVRYCVMHHGIANEDDHACDFARGEDGACDFRQLYRKERR